MLLPAIREGTGVLTAREMLLHAFQLKIMSRIAALKYI
jgi:hypothetical protein